MKAKFLIIAIIITLALAFVSLLKLNIKQPIAINHFDKIQHSIAYFILTLAWLFALGKSKKYIISVVAFCFFYGVIIEFLQAKITSYRTGEILDILANTIGIIMALLIFHLFFVKKQCIFKNDLHNSE